MLNLKDNTPHLNDRVSLALEVIKKAGKITIEDFYLNKRITLKKESPANISCDTDSKSEKIIVNEIKHRFPYDNIISEESEPIEKGGEFLWAIDPLDGTSNFSMNIPYFGICISIQHKGETQFACILNPFSNDLVYAIDQQGVFLNDSPFKIENGGRENNWVGFYIQGYGVSKSQEIENLKNLVLSSKRVLNMWTPSLDWLALLRGQGDYIVTYNTETEDFLPGAFIYQQAGGLVETWDGLPIRLNLKKDRKVTAIAASFGVIDKIKSMVSKIQII